MKTKNTGFRNKMRYIVASLQDFSLFVYDILKSLSSVRQNQISTLKEMYVIGTKALIMVVSGGMFSGIILAIEAGHNFELFGATTLIGRTVSLGMFRELGPVITGLLLASRTGAKNTSEIGAMRLSEQIDALRAFGISPTKKLVIPRVVAALVMFLPLTLIADVAGIFGGIVITNITFHVDFAYLLNSVVTVIRGKDLLVGCLKPIFFAFFIAAISCYYGLKTKGGTVNLGKNAISSVVMSSLVVLGLDLIFTKVIWEIL